MALRHADADHAYLVKVNLDALAENLRVFLDRKKLDAIDAALWLTRSIPVHADLRLPNDAGRDPFEPSPFRPTDVSRVFYCEANPRHLLDAEEIVWVKLTHLRGATRGIGKTVKLAKHEAKPAADE